MCSTPKAPAQQEQPKKEATQPTQQAQQKTDAAPKQEAEATLASSSASYKASQTGLAGRDTRTGARGLGDTATSRKKSLLGE